MTLLIKNTRVFDGQEANEKLCDIFVTDGKISEIGDIGNIPADLTIEGNDLISTPGLIDIHNESDHSGVILEETFNTPSKNQGFTSLIIGQDGISLAPFRQKLEPIFSNWHGHRKNIDWQSFKDFREIMQRRKWMQNIYSQVGSLNLLEFVLTKNKKEEKIPALLELLKKSLQNGARGLSWHASTEEIIKFSKKDKEAILRILKEFGYPLCLTLGKDQEINELEEWLSLSEKTKATLIIKDILGVVRNSGELEIIKIMLGETGWIETTPLEGKTLPISHYLPAWIDPKKIIADLSDDWKSSKIKKELRAFDGENLWLVAAPHHKSLIGKSMSEMVDILGENDEEGVLLRLMQTTGLQATVLEKSLDPVLVENLINEPKCLFGSHSLESHTSKTARASTKHETKTIKKLIEVNQKINPQNMGLLFRKLSYLPSKLFQIPERGFLGKGLVADISIFSSTGSLEFMIVGGEVVWRDDHATGKIKGIFSP